MLYVYPQRSSQTHQTRCSTHSLIIHFNQLTGYCCCVFVSPFISVNSILFHFLTHPPTGHATSDPLQPLPLCLKQEMSPEVTSTSPSPNVVANSAFLELQSLQAPVTVSSSCSSSNHFPHAFNSFSHHAPVYGHFSSQSLIAGNEAFVSPIATPCRGFIQTV